ncbi:DUF2157 domain-containing protein [Litoribrevibacter albus]|uniref:DUF2157 domain-containing protein n=1 Tax=Litoribrevibacter albus TaxID=1473156 RepID=A0AA37S7Z7_9GAMM|nr:DUF2157 domain-containing protein [Litoribrevibacter albus]GLQ30847.1 hypothetical protein GCM10007876_13260 [Litoribrevibacter albus]
MTQQLIPSETRAHLLEFVEDGKIPVEHQEQAVVAAGVRPNSGTWFLFLDKLLLILGGLALSFALLFFIAYNWQELGRFAKFAIVEVAVIIGTLVFVRRSSKDLMARIALLGASISLGVLMALYGQTYQTGADPWELFFNWALLITPWAVVGRFSVLWMFWLGLLNVSLILYHHTFGRFFWVMGREHELLWMLFAFNLCAWVAWELLRNRFRWLNDDWSVRIIATASGACITWLSVDAILRPYGLSGFWVWMIWCVGILYLYQFVKRDLFILAGACLSTIVVVMSFLIEEVMKFDSAGSFLFISLAMIAMGGGSAMWLRSLHVRWLNEE